ncbi:hypothetical protein CPB86DRAFT_250772 [Serendipita vermifera]|nr:hypothetical protein CPB86DRAFT_250772 [Serendipita vermifera]
MHTLSKILTLLSSRGLNRYLTSFQSVDNLLHISVYISLGFYDNSPSRCPVMLHLGIKLPRHLVQSLSSPYLILLPADRIHSCLSCMAPSSLFSAPVSFRALLRHALFYTYSFYERYALPAAHAESCVCTTRILLCKQFPPSLVIPLFPSIPRWFFPFFFFLNFGCCSCSCLFFLVPIQPNKGMKYFGRILT